jgi:ADP-heptose:LPS heptosyltransferase
MKIINLDKELTDFSDTAAVMNNLNLIISTDTAVVHLAGAMGKPIWSILHRSADWRWFLDRNKSPWYPTMRLFRQTKFNNWKMVFDQTSDALLQILNDSKKATEHNKNTFQHNSN